MTESGWVDRYWLLTAEGDTQQRFYSVSQYGFELLRGRRMGGRVLVPREARWQEPSIDLHQTRLPRQLHVNGWVLAFERLAERLISGWRGPSESELVPPREYVRSQLIDLEPADIVRGPGQRLSGYQAGALEPVDADATIELTYPDRARVDLMVKFDWGEDLLDSEEHLSKWDLFLSGWAHLMDRYRPPARPPMLLLVCPDRGALTRLLRVADRALTTRTSPPGSDPGAWSYLARQSILFALEPDIYDRSLRALALPPQPSSNASNGQRRPRPAEIIDSRVLPHQQLATAGTHNGSHRLRAQPSSKRRAGALA
jgi:hypothetical protein